MKKIILFIFVCLFSFSNFCCSKEKTDEEMRNDFIKEQEYYYDEANIKEDWTWFDLTTFKNALNKKAFLKLEYSQLKNKIDNHETFVVCYGFSPAFYQCPYCVACIPLAIEASVEANCDVYYLDIYQYRTNQSEEYLAIYNQILEVFPDFGSKILAPTYMYYQAGVPFNYHVATLKDSEDKNIKDLSSEQKTELINIFKDLFLGNK